MLKRSKNTGLVCLFGLALTVVAIAAGCTSRNEPSSQAAEPASQAVQIAQKTCPVMGGPIDPKIFVEHEGRKVYFCCPGCVAKFKADPAKYLAKLDKSGGHEGSHAGHSH